MRGSGVHRRQLGPRETRVLHVGARGRWFEIQSDGTRFDLSRRRVLARVLEALVTARLERPGTPLSRAELFAAAWPGEHIDDPSQCNRTYVAIATLRKQGLRDLLLTTDGGYLIDPEVEVHSIERPGPVLVEA